MPHTTQDCAPVARPMPINRFFSHYLPCPGVENAPPLDLQESSSAEGVGTRYRVVIDAVNTSNICPEFRLVDVSSNLALCRDIRLYEELLADSVISSRTQSTSLQEHHALRDLCDVPVDFLPGKAYSVDGLQIRVAEIFSKQHRTHVFSLTLCGQAVCFQRWDRGTSVIVSASADYYQNPSILAEFFWRYSHLSPSQRGYDTTARLASQVEQRLLQSAIRQYIEDHQPRNVNYMQLSLDPSYPAYTIEVGKHTLVVMRPFSDSNFRSRIVSGRSTRAYAAYHLQEKRLLFLKDYWRTEHSSMASEGEIYSWLEDADVPFLPNSIGSAYKTRKIFHRDISIGNIMLEDNDLRRGILNDWDHGIEATDEHRGALRTRFGTWNFLSIKWLQTPCTDRIIAHEIQDDLESCYWVLIYMGYHHFAHTFPHGELGPNLKIFSELCWTTRNKRECPFGGRNKSDCLRRAEYGHVIWTCNKPFNQLVREFGNALRMFRQQEDEGLSSFEGRDWREWLGDPENLLELFDRALALDGWPKMDFLPDIYPRISGDQPVPSQADEGTFVTAAGSMELLSERTSSATEWSGYRRPPKRARYDSDETDDESVRQRKRPVVSDHEDGNRLEQDRPWWKRLRFW
ncbi:hypothetical protein K474DRAFT_1707306 [Panus rudis PR-1116 ss-1]|nr:hypothetical protein K474DRAFT_1707306 [Panus rudis PR-1116 ss-1]